MKPVTVTLLLLLALPYQATSTVTCYLCRSDLDVKCSDVFEAARVLKSPGAVGREENCTVCIKWKSGKHVVRACGTAEMAPKTSGHYLEQPLADVMLPPVGEVTSLINFEYLAANSRVGYCERDGWFARSETCLCDDRNLCNHQQRPAGATATNLATALVVVVVWLARYMLR